jgi:hypothetical protein
VLSGILNPQQYRLKAVNPAQISCQNATPNLNIHLFILLSHHAGRCVKQQPTAPATNTKQCDG